jgi:hypothetical protein
MQCAMQISWMMSSICSSPSIDNSMKKPLHIPCCVPPGTGPSSSKCATTLTFSLRKVRLRFAATCDTWDSNHSATPAVKYVRGVGAVPPTRHVRALITQKGKPFFSTLTSHHLLSPPINRRGFRKHFDLAEVFLLKSSPCQCLPSECK